MAIGIGFSGRMALGHRPMRPADVRDQIEALRGLLRGDIVIWEGMKIQLQEPTGYGATLRLNVPVLVAADGPKGFAVARALGDGVFFGGTAQCEQVPELGWKAIIGFGTVLEGGESAASDRASEAVASQLPEIDHVTYEFGGAAVIHDLPGGKAWREGVEQIKPDVRPLEMHKGHLVHPNYYDAPILKAGASQATRLMWVGPLNDLQSRAATMAEQGVTELAFQPSGPDIPLELAAFQAVVARENT